MARLLCTFRTKFTNFVFATCRKVTLQHPNRLMDFNGSMERMDVNVLAWISMDIIGNSIFSRTSMDMNCHEHQKISIDAHPMDIHGFPWTSMDIERFAQMICGFP